MKKMTLSILTAALALSACAAPTLEEYRPVTDTTGPNAARLESDLAQCRAIATQAEADYKKRQSDEMAGRLVAGLIVGAIAGQAIGGNSSATAYGAAAGATSGVASTDTELAHGGPRRIIDRCLTERGHTVLSDLGKG
ncbi:glycine zipper family protein [Paracoccus litorisediminis]|uniref:Glycine zipper family protein n=1 Tax=Paracoccus litorisediminis TaxID=2006130 RepID=A0A844HRS6_9RHOB|nr:glycine zipper family protein [Paracoccus litorisediminis]MTH61134.1 glycine zipper family protein [Paracoccus litorisediminis]